MPKQKSNQRTDDAVIVDLRPGQVINVPMADGSTVTFEVRKHRGRPQAILAGATRERPIQTRRATKT